MREGVRATSLHTEELKDSRGIANFALKWAKDARKAAYLNVVSVKGVTRHMTEADDNVWVPFIGFDCRGLDVIGFHPEVLHPQFLLLHFLLFVQRISPTSFPNVFAARLMPGLFKTCVKALPYTSFVCQSSSAPFHAPTTIARCPPKR